jgi:hypothetical protein
LVIVCIVCIAFQITASDYLFKLIFHISLEYNSITKWWSISERHKLMK